eukprot:1148523-Pelagomonas_calceolata.AAC.2
MPARRLCALRKGPLSATRRKHWADLHLILETPVHSVPAHTGDLLKPWFPSSRKAPSLIFSAGSSPHEASSLLLLVPLH